VIGGVEMVTLAQVGLAFEARIDTGAESSSLHADDIVLFERDGRRWVRFSLPVGEGLEPVTLERKLKRKVLIKQHEGMLERRFVVRLRLQMGTINERVDVTLANRKEMTFPMLIGRNYLTDTAIVDVSRKHTLKYKVSKGLLSNDQLSNDKSSVQLKADQEPLKERAPQKKANQAKEP